MTDKSRYVTAPQAAEALSVKVATLYAYVSRGLLHSVERPGQRDKLYLRADIDSLCTRQMRRRDPQAATRKALQWGDPVIESGITEVRSDRLCYRGHDVTDLAEHASFETVAALLWHQSEAVWQVPAPAPPPFSNLPPVLAFQALLPPRVQDEHSYDFREPVLTRTGVDLARLLACCIARQPASLKPLSELLQRGWKCPREAAAQFNRSLILCADHELNVGTFTARCVASAHAPLAAVVNAGLCALLGRRHGTQYERVDMLWQAWATTGRGAVQTRMRGGDDLPGFGHPLYVEGDPRARHLLQHLDDPDAHRLAADVLDLSGLHPTIDFALVALRRRYRLPVDAPLSLFALGRLAGWIAHALEQYRTGLIRPRARYSDAPV